MFLCDILLPSGVINDDSKVKWHIQWHRSGLLGRSLPATNTSHAVADIILPNQSLFFDREAYARGLFR